MARTANPWAKMKFAWRRKPMDGPEDAKFLVPEEVLDHFRSGIGARGQAERDAWTTMFRAYKEQYPELVDQLFEMESRQLPESWDRDLPEFPADPKGWPAGPLPERSQCHCQGVPG